MRKDTCFSDALVHRVARQSRVFSSWTTRSSCSRACATACAGIRFEIHSASSADEGFEILANHDIDVVVSDERMPQMSGSEFLALVCERYPETVRLILSGQESPDTGHRALYEGEVFRFVRKPCQAGELAEIITQALEDSRRRREESDDD